MDIFGEEIVLSKDDGGCQSFKSFECLKRHHLSTILAGMEDEEKAVTLVHSLLDSYHSLVWHLSSGKKGSLDWDAVCNSLLSLMILVESLRCIILKKNLLLLVSWR